MQQRGKFENTKRSGRAMNFIMLIEEILTGVLIRNDELHSLIIYLNKEEHAVT